MSPFESQFHGRAVLVTGGMGFIGSNLVRRLIALGARVTVVDALIAASGANRANLVDVEQCFDFHTVDVGDAAALRPIVDRCDLVFNLAGQTNHVQSIRDPVQDLVLNTESQLRFLELCRGKSGRVKIVFTSTRQVYGVQERLPVDEEAPARPCDINGVHKLATESHHLLYQRLHGVRTTVIRLSNVYGPRMPIRFDTSAPLMARWISKAVEGDDIEIFGAGTQLRDALYVQDAIDGILAAACSPAVDGEIINMGGTEVTSLREIASILLDAAGAGVARLVPFPNATGAIDIGSIYLDCDKAERLLSWKPVVPLREGLERTIEFYRANRRHYWPLPRHSMICASTTSI